ncbi:MAG: hypothetical protein ACKOA8_17890, partial [Deltaproteobacteria bacterium]
MKLAHSLWWIVVLFAGARLLADLSAVEVCYSPTTFRKTAPPLIGNTLDFMAGAMKVKHAWIRTPYKEMGMGLRPGTAMWTEWVDHAGYGDKPSSQCHFIEDCDEDCVDDALVEGKSLGLYGALNTCQDAVVRVLTQCGCRNTCLKIQDHWPHRCLQWSFPPL